MKTYKEILLELAGRKPAGKSVFDKKLNGFPVLITKEKNEFVVYIDGDRLDSFKSQREAEQSAQKVTKALK